MSNHIHHDRDEPHFNQGDRVRVHIPLPADDPEAQAYERDIPARIIAFKDHLRYNRRRGTVVGMDDDLTYTVKFDDPEDTLQQNPPNIGFLPHDLRLIEDGEDDEVPMTDGRESIGNGDHKFYLGCLDGDLDVEILGAHLEAPKEEEEATREVWVAIEEDDVQRDAHRGIWKVPVGTLYGDSPARIPEVLKELPNNRIKGDHRDARAARGEVGDNGGEN